MRFGKEEINQASKITLVFAVITSIFTLLGKLSTFVSTGENKVSIEYIEHFFQINIAWLIIVILTILGLCIYIKRADGKFNLIFIHNPMIRLTSGLLIIFEGIINLSNKVSVLLFNIQTFLQTASSFGENSNEIIRVALTSNVIPILTNLLQILFGLYLVLYKRKNNEI